MKRILNLAGISAFVFMMEIPSAYAGKAWVSRAFIRNVNCVTLESLPLQYTGTVELILTKNNRRLEMSFPTGEDIDIYEVCSQLQDLEGSTVSVVYNHDGKYWIKGFLHRSHAHIIDGSQFDAIE